MIVVKKSDDEIQQLKSVSRVLNGGKQGLTSLWVKFCLKAAVVLGCWIVIWAVGTGSFVLFLNAFKNIYFAILASNVISIFVWHYGIRYLELLKKD